MAESPRNSVEEEVLPSSCLKGVEVFDTAKPIHRLFEEMMEKNLSHNLVALTYTGWNLNFTFFFVKTFQFLR
jgi:hypothetical protein